MKTIFRFVLISFCILSQAHSISYSVQDLDLDWSESSSPYQINDAGVIVGKLREKDQFYTDFMWTPEKGLILLNPKQATRYQAPLLNENSQVIGLYWKPIYSQPFFWWDKPAFKSQEKNLYTYDLDKGFVNIIPPESWERETLTLVENWLYERKYPSLQGYSNQGDVLVENRGTIRKLRKIEYGIWRDGKYDSTEFGEQCEPRSINSEGIIILLNKKNSVEFHGSYTDIQDKNLFITLNYFENYIGIPLIKKSTSILQVLKNGDVLGVAVNVFEDDTKKIEGFIWNPLKGYNMLPNFIPLAGNTNGQIIGFTGACDQCQEFALWDNGKIYNLNEMIEKDKISKVLQVVDINEAGQIVIKASGPTGDHAYLLNPN